MPLTVTVHQVYTIRANTGTMAGKYRDVGGCLHPDCIIKHHLVVRVIVERIGYVL
jgi:hypothetical protein